MSWKPDDEAIEYLDNLINMSEEVSQFHKKSSRKVLRVLFWMGETLKAKGVPEKFIRKYIPNSAPKIKFSSEPWKLAVEKVDYLFKLYQKMSQTLDESMKEWEIVEENKPVYDF
jgi:hypothetical protein